MNLRGCISLDTETTGLDVHHGASPFLVTICDIEHNNTHWEFPVNPLTREVKYDLDSIQEILKCVNDADKVVLHNATFDVSMLNVACKKLKIDLNWPWEKTHDTLLLSHLVCSVKRHDLTSNALEYLGVDIDKFDQNIRKITNKARNYVRLKGSDAAGFRIARKDLPGMPSVRDAAWKNDMWLPKLLAERRLGPWEESWLTALEEYANADSAVTISLFRKFMKIVEQKNLQNIYEVRRQMLSTIYDMQQKGLTLSESRMQELGIQYSQESRHLENTLLSIAKKEYNSELVVPKGGVNSSLRSLVFEKMKLPPVFLSKKTREPSMDSKTLAVWLEDLEHDSVAHQFISALINKRKRDTALSYCESYKRFWLPVFSRGKLVVDWMRLHPSLNQTGTATLRCSSSNPNEQNISKKEGFNLRYMFGPMPGREWWSMDAKNIELRLPAYESGEKELIDLFERPDDPPYYGSTHLLNFHTVYEDIWNKELESLEKSLLKEFGPTKVAKAKEEAVKRVGPWCKKTFASTWYQWCKNGGFAVQYGAIERPDGNGTADKAFHRRGAHALLKKRFSKLEKLNQKCIHQANRTGYVETIPDKSVDPDRGYPLYCKKDHWGKVKPTVPLNYHIQGTAMWWMGKAMIKCDNQLKEWRSKGFDGHIIMQVHDELVFDLPKGKSGYKTNLPKIRKLASLMSSCGEDLGIPTPVSIQYHPDNWAEEVSIK